MSNVISLSWNTHYETGIPVIDEQRRSMLSMIVSLQYFTGKGAGLLYLSTVIQMLEKLVFVHVSTIKSIMSKTEFSEYQQRAIAQYDLFLSAKEQAQQASTESDAAKIQKTLKEWWMLFHAN